MKRWRRGRRTECAVLIGEKQTPRVYGTEKPGGAAFDPRAKAAARVKVEFEESSGGSRMPDRW